MTQDELIDALLEASRANPEIASASRIDGEPVIAVELIDGGEYFITIEPA